MPATCPGMQPLRPHKRVLLPTTCAIGRWCRMGDSHACRLALQAFTNAFWVPSSCRKPCLRVLWGGEGGRRAFNLPGYVFAKASNAPSSSH